MIQWVLDEQNWDTNLAADGNPRLVRDNLELAQAVACNCKVIMGEDWTDEVRGVPYSLGDNKTSLSQLSEYYKREAKRDPRVQTAILEKIEIRT